MFMAVKYSKSTKVEKKKKHIYISLFRKDLIL